jgi:hypothetical protein
MLVEEFVKNPAAHPGRWGGWLPAVQQRWAAEVNTRPGQPPANWYVETKIQQGAFAAFLGLVLDEPRCWLRRGTWKRWRAVAIGDSCLFQVREGKLLQSVPMIRSADFNNSPWLVGSSSLLGRALRKKQVRRQGEWQSNDRLYLMTDALAQWFLQQVEGGQQPWQDLDGLLTVPSGDAAFGSLVNGLRNTNRLRNDDVTLLTVCL